MPRPRPQYLSREVTRHGLPVWYFRRNGKRIRLRSEFGTPEFEAEYEAARAGNWRSPKPKAPNEGTLAWLIERYRDSSAWSLLSIATKRQRENIFEHVIKTAGDQPLSKITSATIVAGRERRAATPAQARNFLDAMPIPLGGRCQDGEGGPDHQREEPAAQDGAGLQDVDRGRRRGVRGAMAGRHATARVARRPALHRPASRRRRAAWATAYPRWRRYAQDGKGNRHRHLANIAGTRRYARRRTLRRSDVHRGRERSSAHQRVVRQHVP